MLLFNLNTMVGVLGDSKRAQKFTDLLAVYKDKKFFPKDLVSLDDFFSEKKFPEARDALRNMFKKKIENGEFEADILGPNGELPLMNSWIHEGIFGENGFWDQSEAASIGVLEILTAGHKYAKTGLNPASHVQNVLGNVALLSQAGMNVLRPHNAKLLQEAKDVYKVIHDGQVAALKQLGTNSPNKEDVLIFVRRYLATHGKDITYKGKKVPISELADPLVQQLYMEGSFDSIEGLGFLKSAVQRKNTGPAAKSIAKFMLKGTDNKFTRYTIGGKTLPDGTTLGGVSIGRVFDEASKIYMGEDIIPKVALYVKNRAEGYSMNAAVREVAARMPMYGTTGTYIKEARKWAFPWASFPSEIMRITKNNMQDHPLRLLPWFKAAAVAQATFAGLNYGPETAEDAKLGKRLLPFYAQNPGTVVTTTPEGTAMGAGLQSGLLGATLGGTFGGAPGMVAGGVAGAAAGAGSVLMSDTSNLENQIRGAVLAWLPHTSILPKVDSPDYHYWTYDDVLNQLPAEPLAIFRGLMEIMEGRDAFGNPISAESLPDKMGKGVAQLVGFLSPPFFQKYGFQVTTPDVSASEAVSGAFGKPMHLPGDITNVRRLLVDTGQSVDAITGRPGGPVLDLLLNNLGMWKSYRGSGETQLVNQRVSEDRIYSEIRNHHSRQLRFFVMNGDDANIGNVVRRIFNTFSEQYRDNPAMATRQFKKWYKSQLNTIGEHPALRSLSKDELDALFELNIQKTSEIRGQSLKTIIEAIKTERAARDVK
jgi:hypothetical protein